MVSLKIIPAICTPHFLGEGILQKVFFKHVLECIYLKVYRENEKYGIKEF